MERVSCKGVNGGDRKEIAFFRIKIEKRRLGIVCDD
jgi:hypothetical protein